MKTKKRVKRKIIRKPARKLKPIKIDKRKKLKTRFVIQSTEKIIWRDRFGKIRRKPRADLKLIGEIINKKSRKVVGYANYIKSGQVIPRKFSTRYRKFIETKREPIGKYRASASIDTFWFKLLTKYTILEQIRDAAHEAIEYIYKTSQQDGFCIFRMKLHTALGTPITGVMNIRKGTKKNDIGYIMASEIISLISQTNMRMSPKELAVNPKKDHIRSINVELVIMEI